MPKTGQACLHDTLQLEPSAYAQEAGYAWTSPDRRLAATTKSGRNPLATKGQDARALEILTQDSATKLSSTFPGPLVLPNDELALNPKYPPQSFRSWLNENLRKNRKPNNKRRNTLYVATAPEITSRMGFMKKWLQPHVGKRVNSSTTEILDPPLAEDLVNYTSAFYHGMPVKSFPRRLQFVPWDEPNKIGKRGGDTDYVGLLVGNNCTRIRARPCPDGTFDYQLNLEDLLDAAIEMLPGDAYSLILLFDHDIYEDEDDDFCCGRAYGGDGVAVVSTARYHPALDDHAEIDFAHMWPASHCKSYVDSACAVEGVKPSLKTKRREHDSSGPLWAALEAVENLDEPSTAEGRKALWFSKLARTVVHELGHCLGIDHCIYYACVMQGSARMAEDVRQPPYLCPVCLSKVSHAIAWELRGRDEVGKEEYVKQRYRSIADFCESWKQVGLFAGYGAWIRARLEQLE